MNPNELPNIGGENFMAGEGSPLYLGNHVENQTGWDSRGMDVLSEEERWLIGQVNMVIDGYAARAMPTLRDRVRKGDDKKEIKLGEGKTYKLGDVELSIDPTGENILHEFVESMRIPAAIHGEHQKFGSPTGETKVHFAIDPFDNTSEYAAALPTPPWTIVSAYMADGRPIASFVGNIKDNKGYFLQNGKVFEMDLESRTKRSVAKSQRTSLYEEGSVLASYTGSSEYSKPFYREFGEFVDNRPPKALFHGGGGAYIYGPLAAGVIDAYVMFNEPYEEIDPGAAIAQESGCVIGHYNLKEDKWVEYKYDPNRKEKEVDGLFVAAATPEIRDEVVGFYRNKNRDLAEAGGNL